LSRSPIQERGKTNYVLMIGNTILTGLEWCLLYDRIIFGINFSN
jgi:hypothetical protein